MSRRDPGGVVMVLRERVLAVARPGVRAAACGLVVAVLSWTAGIVLTALAVLSLAAVPFFGIGCVFFPMVMALVGDMAQVHRRLARHAGVTIAVPYRPLPTAASFGTWRRFRQTVGDPATWRDFAWLLPGTVAGAVLGLLACCLPVFGLEGASGLPVLLYLADVGYGYGAFWPIENLAQALAAMVQGAVFLAVGLVVAPWVMRLDATFDKLFLGPSRSAELALRVAHLSTTRSDALDAQAAELRRIERDLHDGAQARIVALGMSIGLAEELLHRDPDAAGQLLAGARRSSGEALTDLRNLVRGIHPPVLAERGLTGAVQALALTVPLPVDVDLDVPGRLLPAIESAAYFAVAETLANTTRHSGADRAWITVRHAAGQLTIMVGDTGRGGAEPTDEGGLRGIQRRLAAFDGTMIVSSPPGGPTVVTMELPCALSSPRTSPSSGTD